MTDPTLDWLRSEMEDARGRCEAATEGPWEASPFRAGPVEVTAPESCGALVAEACDSQIVGSDCYYDTRSVKQENATFIAHARRDLPAALSVLDRIGTDLADAEMDALFDALDRLEEACGPEVVEVLGELRDVALRREVDDGSE